MSKQQAYASRPALAGLSGSAINAHSHHQHALDSNQQSNDLKVNNHQDQAVLLPAPHLNSPRRHSHKRAHTTDTQASLAPPVPIKIASPVKPVSFLDNIFARNPDKASILAERAALRRASKAGESDGRGGLPVIIVTDTTYGLVDAGSRASTSAVPSASYSRKVLKHSGQKLPTGHTAVGTLKRQRLPSPAVVRKRASVSADDTAVLTGSDVRGASSASLPTASEQMCEALSAALQASVAAAEATGMPLMDFFPSRPHRDDEWESTWATFFASLDDEPMEDAFTTLSPSRRAARRIKSSRSSGPSSRPTQRRPSHHSDALAAHKASTGKAEGLEADRPAVPQASDHFMAFSPADDDKEEAMHQAGPGSSS